MNQFGEKIRHLREQSGLLPREVAHQLEVDTPMLSKIERGERNAKREQLIILSKIFRVQEDDLLSLWLADKVYEVIKERIDAIKQVNEQIKISPNTQEINKKKNEESKNKQKTWGDEII